MNRIEKVRQDLIKKGKKIINLSSGNPNEHGIIYPLSTLQNTIYEPDPKGNSKARQAVQSYYEKRNLSIAADQVVLTSGTSESYFHLFKLLAKPGEKILFPNPSYPLFEEIARLADIELSFYQLDENNGWQTDSIDLEKKITANTRAIVLISPNNPTGSVLSEETLHHVVQIARKHDVPIISDEVFCEYMFDKRKFPRIAELSNTVGIFTLNGASKTYALPGLKLGWVVVTGPRHQEYVEALERSADAFLSCSQTAQNTLPALVKRGGRFIQSFRKYVELNRDLTIQMLQKHPRISFHKPEGGFYLFAKITDVKDKNGSNITDEEFVIDLLKRAGIFAHPGYFYDYDKDIYLLISLLLPPKKLKATLQKIIKILEMY